jgi:hypothetical protein
MSKECERVRIREQGEGTLFEHELGDESESRLAAGYARLMPAVAFGVRVVALTGLVVSAGVAAAGIGGFFDDSASAMLDGPGSSCCTT